LPQPGVTRRRRLAGVFIGALALIYAWAIFHNQFRTFSSDPLIKPTYFLHDWLIVATVLLPYLIIWLWGTWAVIEAYAFARQVPGVIYQKAFLSVTRGLTVTVLFLIGLQFLSQSTTVFGHAGLKTVLALVYLLLLALATGYVFLARGARQLTSIEEA
jgi:hypothetical protein